jgi:hypothetical protein
MFEDPRPLATRSAVALVSRARRLLGAESMNAYDGHPDVLHDETPTCARLHADDGSPSRAVPDDGQILFGPDPAAAPEGELLFWVSSSGVVTEIELIWYTDCPPFAWPSADMLWRYRESD